MRLSEVANLFGVTLNGDDKKFESVSTDTRTIQNGDLFIALSGENFNGADYLASATEKGAVAAIVDTDVESDIPVFKVQNTRVALGELAAYWRQQLTLKVIGLTGSNGKTTVKEMLTSILSEVGSVAATKGNFNNDIGLPLTLLEIKTDHEYAVIEMGANHIGEIEYLTKLTAPDVAILNNAAAAHLEGFGSLQGVADAKGEIFSGLSTDGVAIINLDDDFSDYWISLCGNRKKIFFGLKDGSGVTARYNVEAYDGCFVLETESGEVDIRLNVLGVHNLKNALAATAAALAVGVELKEIKVGLENFKGVRGRLQVYSAANDSIIIDDSYNANPASLKVAIDVLAVQKKKSVLVLGDMGELGSTAEQLHSDMGEYAREKNIDVLMTYGSLSKYAANSFGENGFSYKEKSELIRDVREQIKNGVAVLVKGSRSMHMEDVVSAFIDSQNSGAS